MSVNRRRAQINAALAGWGIILVVVGHSSGVLPQNEMVQQKVSVPYDFFVHAIEWIYLFHMPLFIFLAGVNFAQFTLPKAPSYLGMIKGKFFRLIVPYILISSLAYPIKVLLSSHALRPVEFSTLSYLRQILFPWDNVIIYFWFMPTLFLIFAISPIYLLLKTVFYRIGILSVAALMFFDFSHHPDDDSWQAFLNLGGVFHNLIFFFVGLESFRLNLLKIKSASVIAIILGSIFWLGFLLSGKINYMAVAFLGIFGSVCLVEMLKTFQGLVFFGEYSFQIYLFSWFFQMPIRILLGQIYSVSIWVSVILSILVGLIVPIFFAKRLDKIVPYRLQYLYGR